MHDSWEGSGSRAEMPDARTDARGEGRVPQRGPEPRPEQRPDPRFESRPDPRLEPRIQEARMYPASGELRGYPQRGYEGRGADQAHAAGQNSAIPNAASRGPEPPYPSSYPSPPRAYEARSELRPESRPLESRSAESRSPASPVADARPAQPYRHDARMQELGQRVQAFGTPSPQGDYRGAPLPVGQTTGPQSGPMAAGGYDRGYPGSAATPNGYDGGYPYGIPPSAPEPAVPQAAGAEAASEPTYAGTGFATGLGDAAQERPQLPASADGDGAALKGGFQRVAQAVRAAIPLVQKLLPLLDGNLATTVSALLAPQAATSHPQPTQVHVDLEPVERGMTELRTSHRELKTQVAEQGTTLKRVEDQLERVREATDRNTLEQQELVEDVRAVGTRVSRFIVIGVLLLALSVGLNVYLLVQLQHIFR